MVKFYSNILTSGVREVSFTRTLGGRTHFMVGTRGGEINCPCCQSRTFVAPDK